MSEHASHEDPEDGSLTSGEPPAGRFQNASKADALRPTDRHGQVLREEPGDPSAAPTLQALYESVPSPGTSMLSACPEPVAETPTDVLTAYLEGAPIASLGPGAEKRLRVQLSEIQGDIRMVIAAHDELRNLLKQANALAGKLGADAEDTARACFDEWSEDDFAYGYLTGVGAGWMRTSQLLGLLGNVMLVKTAVIEAENAQGESE